MVLTWFTVDKLLEGQTNPSTKHYNKDTYNIANIDIEKLDKLVLHLEGNSVPFLVTHFDDPRKRPIYIRRVELPDAKKDFRIICHIMGWQMKVNGENIQSINYVFETDGRVEVHEFEEKDGTIGRKHIPREMYWIESAGKFDRERLSWMKEPSPEQLNVIGSKVIRG
jgi:hypothetical protein